MSLVSGKSGRRRPGDADANPTIGALPGRCTRDDIGGSMTHAATRTDWSRIAGMNPSPEYQDFLVRLNSLAELLGIGPDLTIMQVYRIGCAVLADAFVDERLSKCDQWQSAVDVLASMSAVEREDLQRRLQRDPRVAPFLKLHEEEHDR